MRRLPIFAILSCLPFLALAGPQDALVREFQSRYDRLTKAYLIRDIATAGSLLAADYSAGDYRRPLDKKATLEQLKNWDGRFRTVTRRVLGVVVNGIKATATVDLTTVGKITDNAGPHKIVISARSVDTWEKGAAGWQLKHSKVVHSATTFDGKPSGAGKSRKM